MDYVRERIVESGRWGAAAVGEHRSATLPCVAGGLGGLRYVGDVVAQIYRSSGFRGDEAAGNDVGSGQEGYVSGMREQVDEALGGGCGGDSWEGVAEGVGVGDEASAYRGRRRPTGRQFHLARFADAFLPFHPRQAVSSPLEACPIDSVHTGVVAYENARERGILVERALGYGSEVRDRGYPQAGSKGQTLCYGHGQAHTG